MPVSLLLSGGIDSALIATAMPKRSDLSVYTATFGATDGFSGTGSVSVGAGSYTDAALNLRGAGSDTVAVDRSNPTVTVNITAGALSDGSNSFTATPGDSEIDVSGWDLAALTVTPPADSDAAFTLTVTATSTGKFDRSAPPETFA